MTGDVLQLVLIFGGLVVVLSIVAVALRRRSRGEGWTATVQNVDDVEVSTPVPGVSRTSTRVVYRRADGRTGSFEGAQVHTIWAGHRPAVGDRITKEQGSETIRVERPAR